VVFGLLLLAAVVLAAVALAVPDAAPPAGGVGLVGASVHAAVAAHTKPSQARANLIDIVQTAKAGRATPDPGGESRYCSTRSAVAAGSRPHGQPALNRAECPEIRQIQHLTQQPGW
jgi:hypothetical protein